MIIMCRASRALSPVLVCDFGSFSYKTNHMELTNVSTTRRNAMLIQSLLSLHSCVSVALKVGIILLSDTFPFLYLFINPPKRASNISRACARYLSRIHNCVTRRKKHVYSNFMDE